MDYTETTIEKAPVGSATAEVVFVDEKRKVARLFDGNTAGVIWRRRMKESMQSWLGTPPVDQLPTGRIMLLSVIFRPLVRLAPGRVNKSFNHVKRMRHGKG